jgi:hypothetical protein
MGAHDVLDLLAVSGLTIETDGAHLHVRPRARLTPALRQAVRDERDAVLALLTSRHFRWQVTRVDGASLEVRVVPPQSAPEMRRRFPDATCAPLPDTDAEQEREPRDDRRCCRECTNLSLGGRCLATWRGAQIGTAGREYHPVPDVSRRCEGFQPGPDDQDQRTGAERWPQIVTDGERLRKAPTRRSPRA